MVSRIICWFRGHAEPIPACIVIGADKVPCGVCGRCGRVMRLSREPGPSNRD